MKLFTGIITLLLLSLLLCGCGEQNLQQQSPEECIDTTLTALKELDLETFNDYTNNQQISNRIFSELQQHNTQKSQWEIAQLLVQNLSWEIKETQIKDDTATVTLIIRNHDFSNALSAYTADLIRGIAARQESGANLSLLIKTTIKEARHSSQNLPPYLRTCDSTLTIPVTVTLKQNNNRWQLQLDETLNSALLGNFCNQRISAEIEQKLSAAEELLNNHLKRWNIHLQENGTQLHRQLTDVLEDEAS